MKRLITSALAMACVAMSTPGMADDKYPAIEKEKPGIAKSGDVSPPVAQAMVDDVNLGTAVATDGQIPAKNRTDDFVPGEDIYLTMDVSDAPPGTAIRVVWIGPGDKPIDTQIQKVAAGVSTLKFVKQGTRSWQPGDYRAEVWVGDEKVNDEVFDIVSSRSARK